MKITDLSKKPLLRDFLLMILLGVLSYLFGLAKFIVPGLEGAVSDLRELPLIASVFHLSNPFFTIGLSAITSLGTPADGSYISTFTMHSVAVFISWFFFNFLKKKELSHLLFGVFSFLYVFIYYFILILPLLVITNHIVGLNQDKSFMVFYLEMINASKFEILSTALVISLYAVQFKFRIALKLHMTTLEKTVEERTADLKEVITELKATQQYLIQKEKMASLGTLSAGVAHEINNPLNFISGGNHLIKKIKEDLIVNKSDDIKDKYENATNMINEGLHRATSIVKALMTFSSKDNTKINKTDIHEIIDSTLIFLKFKIPENVSIEKEYKLKNNIPLYPDKIHQVIINVIENAIFELNSVSDKQRIIKISTNQKENNAILEISNNGIQIPDEIINQIFDPFFTTKDPGQGVGLGLSICYSLIAEHNGKISAENTDFGVSIIIELPLNQ